MKICAVIQARLWSQRLPAKILLEMPPGSGITVLERVLNTIQQAKTLTFWRFTSPDKILIRLVDAIYGNCGYWYRGERNPIKEFYLAAKDYEPDVMVRVTCDCPLLRPDFIDEIVNFYLDNDFDYVYNDCDGSDVEVFSFESLQLAYNKVTEPFEIEHITPYIERNFRTALHKPKECIGFKSLDTWEDYQYISEIWTKREGERQ